MCCQWVEFVREDEEKRRLYILLRVQILFQSGLWCSKTTFLIPQNPLSSSWSLIIWALPPSQPPSSGSAAAYKVENNMEQTQ